MTARIKTILLLCVVVFLAVLPSLCLAEADPVAKWRLVKSVPQESGGTLDLILIPENKQRDLDYYRQIGDAVCGKRVQCSVYYWTSGKYIPNSEWLDGPSMQTLTGQYERHPNYREAYHLRLACWLYPSKEEGEKMSCFYMPGAKVPPGK